MWANKECPPLWDCVEVILPIVSCPPGILPSKSWVAASVQPEGTLRLPGVIPASKLCGVTTVKPRRRVADGPPGFVTLTSTTPVPTAGTEPMSWAELTKTVVASFALPKATVAPPPKFTPLIITCVPGVAELGEILVILGGPAGGVV